MVHVPSRKKSDSCNNNGIPRCEEEVLDESALQPIPPDGGWGWMVVFGSFMIHIINDGITYSFGLFYDEFLDYFNEGKGYTAWICSIMVGVTFASGPISSSFVNRYGCRAVTIAGTILASFSIIISMFAQNVLTLIITIGLGTGLGFGLIYLPAIVSVTTYFEAKRSLATGIAVCGSGFGTFVFAPLTSALLKAYGWRGSLLIIGGIVMNCIIFGAMFRPLEPPKPPKKKKSAIIDNNTTPAELEPLKSANNGVALVTDKTAAAAGSEQYLQLPDSQLESNGNGGLCRSSSVGHALQKENQRHSYTLYKMLSLDSALQINKSNGSVSNKFHTSANSNSDIVRASASHPHLCQLEQLRDTHKERSASGTMYRPDALYQGSLMNIPEYSRSRNDLSGSQNLNRYGSLKRSQNLSQLEDEKCCGCISCSKETRDTFAEMMNFSLLKDVVFIIFSISNFCTSIGFNMPYIYIVAQAKTLHLSADQSSVLISIIGVANTVGRIILGYVSDKPWVNRLAVYNWCLTACGVATALAPLCTDMVSLGAYCAVFGFTIGAYVGLTSVILVDLLGLDKLTNAFGLLLLFQGVASFIGPPMGGTLYDITGSYGPAFILAGVMIAISGLVMFAIPPIQRYQAKKSERQNAVEIALS